MQKTSDERTTPQELMAAARREAARLKGLMASNITQAREELDRLENADRVFYSLVRQELKK